MKKPPNNNQASEHEDFTDAKNLFFFNYLQEKIPQELQSLYQENISFLKAGFEAGIRFVLSQKK